MSNQKKNIVVTGATKGIGRGVVEYLANCENCQNVVAICRPGSKHTSELRQKFNGNPKVHIFDGDVAELNDLEKIGNQLKQKGIEPDLVLNNAGIITSCKPVWDVTQEEMDNSYKVNIRGVFNSLKVYVPMMRNKKNAVVANVSSDWGICGSAGRSAYCMSKFGVEGLTKTVAFDVEKDDLAIVSVSPGMVFSDMLVAAYGQEHAKKIGAPLEQFVPHFVQKLMGINKSQNGQHLDFSFKEGERAVGK
jgi:NAD(P)-dependent dehydrogenase (short-subunit alcohol dehydrogenase family)